MDTQRRANYESGSDYVLEYGELRFTFNERDFTERVEQAAIKLDFVPGPLADEEREDLVNLAVNGEVSEPSSTLGEHINHCWTRLVGASERSLVHWLRPLVFRGAWVGERGVGGASERSLVHWLRRLVFRGAWLDQRVMEGELEIVFDDSNHTFGYTQPDRDYEVIELSPEPSWAEVAYRV